MVPVNNRREKVDSYTLHVISIFDTFDHLLMGWRKNIYLCGTERYFICMWYTYLILISKTFTSITNASFARD